MLADRLPRHIRLILIAGAMAATPSQAAPRPSFTAVAEPRVAVRTQPAMRPEAITAQLRSMAKGKLRAIYAERNFAPLWAQNGIIGPEADGLIIFLNSAQIDGLKPSSYKPRDVQRTLNAARRPRANAKAISKAELALSKALALYAMDLRRLPQQDTSGVIYADQALQPKPPLEETALRVAAFAPSFANYVNYMQWMSPQYLRIRNLLWKAASESAPEGTLRRIRLNLERARYLPGPMTQHILVDAASAQLWYYQTGTQQGTMRVVVGKPESPTPMLVGTLQHAIFNPYWNIPVDLVQTNTAPKVLAGRTLKSMNMEALSDWSENARVLNPKKIDWHAVAAGVQELRVRQLPGPYNSMGQVKFLFPNDLGIYLHDTPERELMSRDARHFSNGCIRLEDAAGLTFWLLRQSINPRLREREKVVALPAQVPVYISYFTVTEGPDGVVLINDVYERDK
jgi:L,D-transpeptidase YcbB